MLKEVLQNLFLKKIQQDMKLYPRSLGVSIAAGLPVVIPHLADLLPQSF